MLSVADSDTRKEQGSMTGGGPDDLGAIAGAGKGKIAGGRD